MLCALADDPIVSRLHLCYNIGMLERLTIRNLGLIDKITVDFRARLNVLTGETGAGKSILIDALRFALGERISSSFVRDPGRPCTVEAAFRLGERVFGDNDAFSEYFTEGDELTISRSYLPDGRTRARINGFTVTVGQLKELGDRLVDFHGPHDHQLLFSPASHMSILDRLSGAADTRAAYHGKFRAYAELRAKQEELKALAAARDREIDVLAGQIKELERVPLDEKKYGELVAEQKRIDNAEKINEYVSAIIGAFEHEEAGIIEAVSRASGPMRALEAVDPEMSGTSERLRSLQDDAAGMLTELARYRDRLSFDSSTARDINLRYDIYYDIKRKYGPSLDDARSFYEQVKKKHDTMVNLEHEDAELSAKKDALKKELEKLAGKITDSRKKTAADLRKTIEKELTELGIKNVKFECRIGKTELNADGTDTVEFYISPNAGEAMKPLAEIVSSGEAARVMLALKKALTKVDPVPVLIFDEIDAQIGGRLGTVTGRKLKELSAGRQVILITHLPQIASFADFHYLVYKTSEKNHTVTVVEELMGETRVKELAKMMSGEKETNISIRHAQDMLAKAQ